MFCAYTGCCQDTKAKKIDLSNFLNYPDTIFKNIESEKIALKNKKSTKQVSIAYWTYMLLKDFILKMKPGHILYLQPPEDMEGMIIGGLANELNIPLAVPCHTRNMGLSFFSFDQREVLPKASKISQNNINKAKLFLKNFRQDFISPTLFRGNEEYSQHSIQYKPPSKLNRLKCGVARFFSKSENRGVGTLRVSLLNNWFPMWRNTYRGLRKLNNKRYYNCETTQNLPNKFIYFPIQYSPESSINIPAPYFIDQLRVIDAIRMSMPSHFLLVVKEHPACMEVRSNYFTKSLLKKAGVIVAKYDIDSQELIKRSQITISVTGTAAFEAFLYGKPSLVMGPTFFAQYLDGVCKIDELSKRIKQSMSKDITDKCIIKNLSEIYAVSSGFVGKTPGDPGGEMMTYENLDAFWSAFIEHAKRS